MAMQIAGWIFRQVLLHHRERTETCTVSNLQQSILWLLERGSKLGCGL